MSKKDEVVKVYRTETQDKYDCLMRELDNEGYIWFSSRENLKSKNVWLTYRQNTCIFLYASKKVSFSDLDWANKLHPTLVKPFYPKEEREQPYTVTIPNGNKHVLVLMRTKEHPEGWLTNKRVGKIDKLRDKAIEEFIFTEEEINNLYPWLFKEHAKKYVPIQKFYLKLFDDDKGMGYLNSRSGELFVDSNIEEEGCKTKFTMEEIKALGDKYIPFAVPADSY